LFCDAGTGTPEIEQQEELGDGAILDRSSAIFIRSHSTFVLAVAHSAGLPVKIAQTETGTDPNPAKLSANAKMIARRIAF
jgi:hypothetical protein